MSVDPLVQQARTLLAQGRPSDALAVTAPIVAVDGASYAVVSTHAGALKVLGRIDEALAFHRQAVITWPDSVVAWHNLGALAGDAGDAAESREAIDRALALGGNAAATWLVRARACWLLEDRVGAEDGYRKALARQPNLTEAACELAQAVWLGRADADAAAAPLATALAAGADPARIVFSQSQLLQAVGRTDEARALVIAAARARPDQPALMLLAVRAAVEDGQTVLALEMVEQVARLGAPPLHVDLHRVMALLAAGRTDEALVVARRAAAGAPNAQDAWGWVATAARAAGDPHYGVLHDYDALVRGFDIETPEGWPNLAAYLADLERALDAAHTDRAHRLDQSARGGTQTFGDLSLNPDPAIQAFYAAIDAPIRRYLAELGSGKDPLRRRNTGDYALNGSWSVRLSPRGHHVDHFHPAAFISSAFHVRMPEAALDIEHQGWLRFGQSPFPSVPPLAADHHVRPVAGRLVLFPSYMWHGTVPFEGEETRLSIAFDVVPA
ncbi:putative 2OG-Fe(II) oxygenase [soil metagenome]